ncbi:very short patch repair endonuclease [Frankia sp. AgKG'84/4]|nr:very short patch repair endonuclease [Frankia sp. AgKG'84/4]
MSLRRELHRRGLRYRVSNSLIGRPDLVFGSAKVACFVDGDRWHGNGWRLRGLACFEDEFQHSNSEFWKAKIRRNIARDQAVTASLEAAGWRVIRVWASDVERDVSKTADLIEMAVRGSGGGAGR